MGFVWLFLCLGAGFVAGWAVAARQYRERERLRARFLSFVAHELNTPVTSLYMTVMNFISGLFGPVAEEQKPWIGLIREQTFRLSSLVGDLRDLIHAEFHNDLHLSPEKASLADVVAKCVDGMRESFARSGAELRLALEPDLPPIYADPDRLGRSLSAILTHARKFRLKGPVALEAKRQRETVSVSVRYAGSPVPRERLERSLDVYFPVLTPESQVLAGVGLGLGLPRRLIEAGGGRMTLEVDPGGGTVIRLELPRYSENEAARDL